MPLDVKTLEETTVDGLMRRKIDVPDGTARPRRARTCFFRRANGDGTKRPAVLCLHQTTNIGKQEPAGLGGNPNLHYALHLAQRGYVTLAPDYPSFGEHAFDFADAEVRLHQRFDESDLGQHARRRSAAVACRRWTASGSAASAIRWAGTTRCSRPPSIRASRPWFRTAASRGSTSTTRGIWRAGPAHATCRSSRRPYHNNPDEVPFDFPEIVAAFAPRPFLASSPVGDSNFEVSGVRDTIAAAKPIYALYGKPDNLQANYPDCAHDFPEDVRHVAYEFLDKHLQGQVTARPSRPARTCARPGLISVQLELPVDRRVAVIDFQRADGERRHEDASARAAPAIPFRVPAAGMGALRDLGCRRGCRASAGSRSSHSFPP